MNLFTVFSLIGGISCIALSIVASGSIMDFLDLPSVFVVFGGVFGATMASFSAERIKRLLKALKVAFEKGRVDLNADIEKIIEIANTARRNGLLALEELTEDMEDPFLKKGILLVVDGSDPELIRSIMETELSVIQERHAENRAILDAMAAYSPAFGMIGTLIGLINMLKNMDDMGALGPNMSVALVTTFYGTMLANLVFSPLSKRLKALGSQEYLQKELILEGIMAIQNGENPRVIKEKLSAFLPNAEQQDERPVGAVR
ncbi:MAG: motility protein A [Clostridiales bacterium]|nr:motility protein A [Clostridiales bacterium]